MRWSRPLFALAILGVSGPALAEQGNDAPVVTVLRGASAPPTADPPPPVVVQTVVYPQVVYVPTYYPAYSFYDPGFFIRSRQLVRHQFSTPGLMQPLTAPLSGLSALRPVGSGGRR